MSMLARSSLLVVVLAHAVAGCALSHTLGEDGGRPATAPDAATVGTLGPSCVPVLVPAGGFTSSEIFVETYTPVCGEPPLTGVPTRPPMGVCVVYGLEGDPRPGCTTGCASPADVAERTFCTCRCGGDPGTGPFCTCPEATRCEQLVSYGGRSGGAFCVPDSL